MAQLTMTGLWPQNFWLGTHPSSGSVHDASLSREPGWVRSCLPSDERHVGFWMESDSCPPLEHLFAKICFSVISSILSFFFFFLLEKIQSIQKLYIALLVFAIKGRLPLIQGHSKLHSCLVFSTGAVPCSRVFFVFGFTLSAVPCSSSYPSSSLTGVKYFINWTLPNIFYSPVTEDFIYFVTNNAIICGSPHSFYLSVGIFSLCRFPFLNYLVTVFSQIYFFI